MSRWKRALVGGGALLGVGALVSVAAVAYGALTGLSGLQYPEWPGPELQASTDPEVIERGRYLVYGPAHCAICHSTTDRAHPEKALTEPLHGGLEFAMGPFGTRYAPNLTPDPETGIARWTDAQLARTIRTGVLPNGELSMFMGMSVGEMSDEDLVAVLSYLRSLPPVKNEVPEGHYGVLAKVMLAYGLFALQPRPMEGPAHVSPAEEPTIDRGKYLAEHVAFCDACHTPSDPSTFQPSGPLFSGGTPEASHGEDHEFEFAPPNLTSAPTGYVGRVSEDAFVQRMRAGRQFESSIMPWECFGTMTDNDLRSVYRYLRTVPPIDVDTGPSYRKIGSFTADAG